MTQPAETPVIRAIADGDVAAVIALWHAAGLTRPWNDPAHDIAFARRGAHSTVLVAEIGGAVATAAMIGEDGHRGWVYYLATLPERQGSGLGRAMMQAAEAWLTARGIWKVNLLVRDDNAAVRGFYERLGYRKGAVTCMQKALGDKRD
jgi:ribosomal protein S18 acetylase RimI-like enzyme